MQNTIFSLREHPGNAGNFDREVIVRDNGNYITLSLTNHWDTEQSYAFALSYKAAEELMTTLDLFLSGNDNNNEEEEDDV